MQGTSDQSKMLKKRKQQTEPRRRRRTGDVYLEAVPS